jgi:hypothetical protein
VLATILGPAPGPAYTRTVQGRARLRQAMQENGVLQKTCLCAYSLALRDGLMTNVNPRLKEWPGCTTPSLAGATGVRDGTDLICATWDQARKYRIHHAASLPCMRAVKSCSSWGPARGLRRVSAAWARVWPEHAAQRRTHTTDVTCKQAKHVTLITVASHFGRVVSWQGVAILLRLTSATCKFCGHSQPARLLELAVTIEESYLEVAATMSRYACDGWLRCCSVHMKFLACSGNLVIPQGKRDRFVP